jgi:glutamine cyclotransferase
MHCYEICADGSLKPRDGVWQVPCGTQGLAVTRDLFLYSSSYGRNNRSRIYVVRHGKRSTDLDRARLARFHASSLSEGMTVCGDDVYLVYASGARAYKKGRDRPRNIIGRLHKAPLSSLRELCH